MLTGIAITGACLRRPIPSCPRTLSYVILTPYLDTAGDKLQQVISRGAKRAHMPDTIGLMNVTTVSVSWSRLIENPRDRYALEEKVHLRE